jgi:hypothetical protein
MKNTLRTRHGYAMTLVLIFIVLFLALLGVVYRELAGTLRIESLHSLEVQRDTGSVHALARGLALLESGLPPTNPYACGVTIETPGGPLAFTVTFTTQDGVTWQVCSAPTAPGEAPPPMPGVFGTTPAAGATGFSLPGAGSATPSQ